MGCWVAISLIEIEKAGEQNVAALSSLGKDDAASLWPECTRYLDQRVKIKAWRAVCTFLLTTSRPGKKVSTMVNIKG